MENTVMRPYERLISYTKYETVSREDAGVSPSTPEQTRFGKALAEELRGLGVRDVEQDGNGFVYGTIPANVPGWSGPVIAFLAHMDVSSSSPWENVQARVVSYEGGDILLGGDVVLREKEFPALSGCIGKTLVVTDGTTLLGADDKAGIAEIMALAETLLKDNTLPRGTVKLCFTPDEEIGGGADLLDLTKLGADYAYTLDGDAFGAVEYETFNAATAEVSFKGISVHPGSAKNVMRNAVLMAVEFIEGMPAGERPETTELYEGYYFAEQITCTVEEAKLTCYIRDHDAVKFAERKAYLIRLAEKMNGKYGPDAVRIAVRDSYRNMKEQILPQWHLIDTAYDAVRASGGKPFSSPVRGGTDGAALSYRGLPCPNLGIGCGNYHSRLEYACAEDMDACVRELLHIVSHYAFLSKLP